MNQLQYVWLLSLMVYACASHHTSLKAIPYTQVAIVKCQADPTHTYQLSLPEDHAGSLPLVVILDPHGNGKLAVKSFLPAVTDFRCILAGSDAVHNYMNGYVETIGQLIADVKSKYAVSQVFLAGFSGGARMALGYAVNHGADGVLMCSAGPGQNQGELPFPVFMIAGISDFNFGETYYNPLKASPHPHMMSAYFEGFHEWPPADKIRGGLVYLMGQYLPDGAAIGSRESQRLTQAADSLLEKEEAFLALKDLELAIKLDRNNKKAKKTRETIRHDRGLSGSIDRLEMDLSEESNIGQSYAMATMQQDSSWWFQQLDWLQNEIANNTGDRKAHFMRIKAFLGILFYTRLNTMLHEDPPVAVTVHLLAAYRKAEPRNPDAYYDYALYEMKKGRRAAALSKLKHAIQLGFADRKKMAEDFPGISL